MIAEGKSIYNVANYTTLTAQLISLMPAPLAKAFRANIEATKQLELLLWSGSEARTQAQAMVARGGYLTDSDSSIVCFVFKLIEAFERALASAYQLKPVEESLHDITRCALNVCRGINCAYLIYLAIDGKPGRVKLVIEVNVLSTHSYFSQIESRVLMESGRSALIVNIKQHSFVPVPRSAQGIHAGPNFAPRTPVDALAIMEKWKKMAAASAVARGASPQVCQASNVADDIDNHENRITQQLFVGRDGVRIWVDSPTINVGGSKSQPRSPATTAHCRLLSRSRSLTPCQSPKTPPLTARINGASLLARRTLSGNTAAVRRLDMPQLDLDRAQATV